jgi:hypothetical protein
MLPRNFRMLIPIAYGLAVAFAGIFAPKAVTIGVTVIGALVIGVGYYALGFSRDRS